jgi:hypothetical protein
MNFDYELNWEELKDKIYDTMQDVAVICGDLVDDISEIEMTNVERDKLFNLIKKIDNSVRYLYDTYSNEDNPIDRDAVIDEIFKTAYYVFEISCQLLDTIYSIKMSMETRRILNYKLHIIRDALCILSKDANQVIGEVTIN